MITLAISCSTLTEILHFSVIRFLQRLTGAKTFEERFMENVFELLAVIDFAYNLIRKANQIMKETKI